MGEEHGSANRSNPTARKFGSACCSECVPRFLQTDKTLVGAYTASRWNHFIELLCVPSITLPWLRQNGIKTPPPTEEDYVRLSTAFRLDVRSIHSLPPSRDELCREHPTAAKEYNGSGFTQSNLLYSYIDVKCTSKCYATLTVRRVALSQIRRENP